MNNGGARTDLMPEADGTVRFGQIFAMQPFANNVVTKSYTGRRDQGGAGAAIRQRPQTAARPNLLMPSANFRFSYDKSRPDGQRIVAMTLNGKPIDPAETYRVAINNFLASGGDNFTLLRRAATRSMPGSISTRPKPISPPTRRCRCWAG